MGIFSRKPNIKKLWERNDTTGLAKVLEHKEPEVRLSLVKTLRECLEAAISVLSWSRREQESAITYIMLLAKGIEQAPPGLLEAPSKFDQNRLDKICFGLMRGGTAIEWLLKASRNESKDVHDAALAALSDMLQESQKNERLKKIVDGVVQEMKGEERKGMNKVLKDFEKAAEQVRETVGGQKVRGSRSRAKKKIKEKAKSRAERKIIKISEYGDYYWSKAKELKEMGKLPQVGFEATEYLNKRISASCTRCGWVFPEDVLVSLTVMSQHPGTVVVANQQQAMLFGKKLCPQCGNDEMRVSFFEDKGESL